MNSSGVWKRFLLWCVGGLWIVRGKETKETEETKEFLLLPVAFLGCLIIFGRSSHSVLTRIPQKRIRRSEVRKLIGEDFLQCVVERHLVNFDELVLVLR